MNIFRWIIRIILFAVWIYCGYIIFPFEFKAASQNNMMGVAWTYMLFLIDIPIYLASIWAITKITSKEPLELILYKIKKLSDKRAFNEYKKRQELIEMKNRVKS